MNPIKKLKSKRGITFVEVLLVLVIMTIMLAIAAPNILAESENIQMSTLNSHAQAVAVAVQSRLYGMKNAATAKDTEYYLLNDAAEAVIIETEEDQNKEVKYVTNFGEKGAAGKNYFLSGAITDTEILKNGKIVVVYDPNSADVLEVFYGEKEFDVAKLFPKVTDAFLRENHVGLYRGDPKPVLELNVGLPDFSIVWQYDDEMYLQLQMGTPDPSLYDKELGLEVFAVIPNPNDRSKEAEILIYAEGMFDTDYGNRSTIQQGEETITVGEIRADYGSLTIGKIRNNGNILRFAFDSLVTKSANWGNAGPYLRHQTNPEAITAANNVLYPRETIADWFNEDINPYLKFGKNEELGASTEVYDAVTGKNAITEIINVEDNTVYLHVELHALSEEKYYAIGDTTAMLHYFDDENFVPRKLNSEKVSPYFYAIAEDTDTVALSSMRDLNNLSYVFETKNDIIKATLSSDIEEQQLQDKFMKVRQALMTKSPEANWYYGANWSAGTISPSVCRNKEEFTLSGKKADGTGSYAIKCFRLDRMPGQGGLFSYAKNCTFEYLDIINPLIPRNGTGRSFLLQGNTGSPTRITGLNMDSWNHNASGALVGVAVGCTFTNVRVYIDSSEALKIDDGNSTSPQGIGEYRVTGTVVGGLVGIAIGDKKNPTKFNGCAASVRVSPEQNWTPGECLYAGGLVGLSMGEVQINNSYAASEISGYYAGGIVGGVGFGNWSYLYIPDNNTTFTGTAQGNLSITDSFSAGYMMYNIRVGGGLIGHVDKNDKNNVKVSGCYSAVHWKILPPVAYGTFAFDDAGNNNYYVYQQKLDFPVTANILARFECSGDVFSLQPGSGSHGVPCSESMLKTNLGEEKWTNAISTHKWSWMEGALFSHPLVDSYPFPMPKGNTDFYGEWINSYDDTGSNVPNFQQTRFDGFYVAYYNLNFSYGTPRFIEAFSVITLTRKIELNAKNEVVVRMVYDDKNPGPFKLKDNGMFKGKDGKDDVYWAKALRLDNNGNINNEKDIFGQGIDGATKITAAENGKIDFYSAAYYDPNYNVVKGSDFHPTPTDDFNYGAIVPLMWDYCGYYLLNYGNGDDATRYYISFQKENGDTVAQGEAVRGRVYSYSWQNPDNPNVNTGDAFSTIVVNEKEFKAALKYDHIKLSATDVKIQWKEQTGYFYVTDGGTV